MPMATIVACSAGADDGAKDQRDQDFREGPGQVHHHGHDAVEPAAEPPAAAPSTMPHSTETRWPWLTDSEVRAP
jgi:hypothetical protein